MHGRLRVRSSEEKKAAEAVLKEKKLAAFKSKLNAIISNKMEQEHSPEMLLTTQEFLLHYSDYGTVWNYRREILLDEIKKSTSDGKNDAAWKLELAFTKDLLSENPKSYNVWFHRRWVLDHMAEPNWNRELELCDYALELDERNFHCWDYRQEIVTKARAPLEKELAFSTKLIKRNLSNYSAWHYRTIILPRLYPNGIPEAQIKEDLGYVVNALAADINDQSVWFYSQFLLDHIDKGGFTQLLEQFISAINDFSETDPDNQWVLYAGLKLGLLQKKSGGIGNFDEKIINNHLDKLIEVDPMRKGCYESLRNQLLDVQMASGDAKSRIG